MNMNEAELRAERANNTIVKFTNVSKNRFIHQFNGVETSIDAGKSMVMRLPMAEHFATHLARKMIMDAKKAEELGQDKAAFTEEEVKEISGKIITVIDNESPERMTEQEAQKKDMEEIQKKYDKDTRPEVPKVTKQKVIKELREMGEDPDPKLTIQELLQIRQDLEMNPKN